jgi:ubiquitin carboxyl-terminal hydrolase L5
VSSLPCLPLSPREPAVPHTPPLQDWTTIESDPGVFTSLCERFGSEGVEFEELYSMDDSMLPSSAHGLIFLFKWTRAANEGLTDKYEMISPDELAIRAPSLFFAKQVVQNACATQAILSILMNIDEGTEASRAFKMGEALTDLKAFTGDFPPDMKGEMIGMQDRIREAHNSFSRQDPFISDEKKVATDDDDVFHFIAYVPHGGVVYELDGLKPGPVVLGDVPSSGENWLKVARERIQDRIEKYAATEIKFNLMAVVEDKRVAIQSAMAAAPGDTSLVSDLQQEEQKRAAWAKENDRRQHNYIPFVIELIKQLAEKSKLRGMVAQGDERAASKRAAKKAKM